MMRLYIEPADNIMIRDGRPFNQDDAGRAAAASRFPPPPDTVYGAVRVALARALNWGGIGDWTTDSETRRRLLGGFGEASEAAAELAVAGPFFEVAGVPLLPLPAAAVQTGKPTVIEMCYPDTAARASDLGKDVRFIKLPAQGGKSLGGRWGPAAAVRQILQGDRLDSGFTPADFAVELPRPGAPRLYMNKPEPLAGISVDELGVPEARVGLERDVAHRTAIEGKLYASVRRVLPPQVSMYVEVSGVELDPKTILYPVPFGGEARFVFLTLGDVCPALSRRVSSGGYAVALTTPAILPAIELGMTIDRLPGTLQAAVVSGVSLTASFVRSGAGKRALTAPRAVVPAGTVLFMSGAGGDLPAAIGERCWRGYGRFEVGAWKNG